MLRLKRGLQMAAKGKDPVLELHNRLNAMSDSERAILEATQPDLYGKMA